MGALMSHIVKVVLDLLFVTPRAIGELLAFVFIKPVATHSGGLVLVTGAGRGFGKGIVIELAQAGYTVIAGVRKESDAARLKAEIPTLKHTVLLDVGSDASVTASIETVDAIASQTGMGLVAVVNNAAILPIQSLELSSKDMILSVMNVNFHGPVRIIQAFLPALRKTKGRIVNVSSIGADLPLPCVSIYQASKAALNQMTNVLRIEVAKQGISVSTVNPGQIDTDMASMDERAPAEPRQGVDPASKALYDRAYKSTAELKSSYRLTPRDLTKATVLHAIQSSRPLCSYHFGWDSVFMRAAVQLLPESVLAASASKAIM